MGFIQDNTNSVEVYLTDLGREKFLNGGLMTAIKYFSITDDDSNYDFFTQNPNEVLTYDSSNLSNYVPGDYVVTGGTFYRFTIGTGSRTAPPSNWWIPTILFDPNVITSQPIPTINHNGTKLTSLGIDTNFINDVFIQTRLRGSVVDNKNINNVITTIKSNTQRSYVPYNPDVAQSVAPITTYINV